MSRTTHYKHRTIFFQIKDIFVKDAKRLLLAIFYSFSLITLLLNGSDNPQVFSILINPVELIFFIKENITFGDIFVSFGISFTFCLMVYQHIRFERLKILDDTLIVRQGFKSVKRISLNNVLTIKVQTSTDRNEKSGKFYVNNELEITYSNGGVRKEIIHCLTLKSGIRFLDKYLCSKGFNQLKYFERKAFDLSSEKLLGFWSTKAGEAKGRDITKGEFERLFGANRVWR